MFFQNTKHRRITFKNFIFKSIHKKRVSFNTHKKVVENI